MADAKKLNPPIPAQNFTMLQQVSLDFAATPRAGATIDDVMEPSYWMTIAHMLKVGSEIRVIPEDNSWYARLLIISVDKISATMGLIMYSDLKKRSTVSEEQFEIRTTHNNTKYGVFRKSDGVAVKQGLATEKQAEDYLSNYVRTMVA
jgi:hypothetical protein